jgi:nucleotide-binding universal stress UspA family protein
MFRRILLALDNSPAGQIGVSFAQALAARSEASVYVLHINEYLVGGRGVTLETSEEATALVVDAVAQLRAEDIEATGGVGLGHYLHVASRIVEVAERQSADVILLGSERKRRLQRLFSKGVRERTTRLTTLPVLTAPSPLRFSTRQGSTGLQALEELAADLPTTVL